MRRALSTLFVLTLSGCSGLVGYERGSPLRIDTKRAAEKLGLRVTARDVGDRVEIAVDARARVRLERQLIYQTYEVRQNWSAIELVSFPLELLMGFQGLFLNQLFFNDDASRFLITHSDGYDGRPRIAFQYYAGFSPFHTLIGGSQEKVPSRDERFKSERARTEFGVASPVPGTEVSWMWLDVSEALLRSGRAVTDDFGIVITDSPPEGARLLRIIVGEARIDHVLPARSGLTSETEDDGGDTR